MVCPTCGLDNDPSAPACARCNTTLGAAPQPPPSAPPYERRPRSQRPLVVGLALVVIVLIALVGVVYRNGRPDPPVAAPPPPAPPAEANAATPTVLTAEPAADPRPQAEVIDALLDRSIASRDKLNGAINRVGRCTGLADALADLRTVGDERRAQIAEVRSAELSALSNGESIRSALDTALRHSLDADEAYLEWTEPAAAGECANTAGRRAARARGDFASKEAGAAKEAFLDLWNPVAAQLGLATRSRQKI